MQYGDGGEYGYQIGNQFYCQGEVFFGVFYEVVVVVDVGMLGGEEKQFDYGQKKIVVE